MRINHSFRVILISSLESSQQYLGFNVHHRLQPQVLPGLLFKPLVFCLYISGPILFTTGIILGLYQQQQYKLEQAGADKGFA